MSGAVLPFCVYSWSDRNTERAAFAAGYAVPVPEWDPGRPGLLHFGSLRVLAATPLARVVGFFLGSRVVDGISRLIVLVPGLPPVFGRRWPGSGASLAAESWSVLTKLLVVAMIREDLLSGCGLSFGEALHRVASDASSLDWMMGSPFSARDVLASPLLRSLPLDEVDYIPPGTFDDLAGFYDGARVLDDFFRTVRCGAVPSRFRSGPCLL